MLQISIGIVFGAFLTLCGNFMGLIPDLNNIIIQFALMIISTALVAFGVFLYVPAGFVPLAPEGFLIAVSTITGKEFSTVKITSDVAMAVISLVICIIMISSFGSVGIGTVVAAVLVGAEVRWMTKHLQRIRNLIRIEESS